MSNTALPFGHPSTLRDPGPGGFPCKGSGGGTNPDRRMTARQIAWMKEHKPLYFTGDLMADISHLPAHLRTDG